MRAIVLGGLVMVVFGAACGSSTPVELAAGGIGTCARFGDGKVACWGGHLSEHTTVKYEGHLTPAAVQNVSGADGLCAGSAYACARLHGGTVECWAPEAPSRGTPVAGLTEVSALWCGSQGGCAQTTSALRCWDWTSEVAGTVETVAGLGEVTSVAVGARHRCALNSEGQTWCWGDNRDGQLGVSKDVTTTDKPVLSQELSEPKQLVAGDDFTCALSGDGRVLCFGSNAVGQLGATDGASVGAVQVTDLSDVVEVAAGGRHACARRQDGTVWCWGRNLHGELGDGTDLDRRAPVQVSGVTGAVGLALGDDHSCAQTEDGKVLCWGGNLSGQLGNGGYDDSVDPVEVDLSGAH